MITKMAAQELAARLSGWNQGASALYLELAAAIETLVRDGRIVPGTRLPAERLLAGELSVSRGTVMAAYERLREHGIVRTVHGSGTVIGRAASPVSGPREAHLASALPENSLLTSVASPASDHAIDEVIDLRGAYWVGTEGLERITSSTIGGQLDRVAHHYGYEVRGLAELRRAVADHLTSTGLPTNADELLITSGAQQAISLVAQLYVGAGDHVVIEDPTYPGAMEVMLAQQATIVRVPVGEAGVNLPALREAMRSCDPRLTYLTSSVHNPTGIVMPGAARQRLVEMLASWDTVVLDDTTLMDTQWQGEIPAPLAAYADPDTCQRIVTVGSLSKSIWAGLRIGWARAHPATIERLIRLKNIADLGTPIFGQLMAADLLQARDLVFGPRRAELRQRQALLGELLGQQLPDWRWSAPNGGMTLWVDLGDHDTAAFVDTAARFGVAILAPSVSSATDRFPSHLRIPFGRPPEILEQAVARLAAAWSVHLGDTPLLDEPRKVG